jgi:hypothetical protein
MRVVFRVGWSRTAERIVRLLDRVTRVPPVPITWHHPAGPYFGNILALLTFNGPAVRLRLERAVPAAGDRDRARDDDQPTELEIVADRPLTDPAWVTP